MRIDQAIYGEVKGGHALRAFSGARQVAQDITARLDLPDTAPAGACWSPYVSGFAHGNHYILARTFADISAPRAGMVLTHALITPIKELSEVRNLAPLFGKLMTSINQTVEPARFEQSIAAGSPPVAPDLIAVANALATRGIDPVVRSGTDGFEALVISLWANLWPETRRTFGFRLSFGPSDVVETPPPNLVCTPLALIGRWSRHRVVNGINGEVPESNAAALLAGQGDPSDLLSFAREFGASLSKLQNLPLFDEACRLSKREEDNFENVVAALRLLDRLSPDPRNGDRAKIDLLARLVSHISSARPSQMLTLRNLDLTGFPRVESVWKAVKRWAAGQQLVQADDELMVSIVTDATIDTHAVDHWRNAIRSGLTIAARTQKSGLPEAIWRWVSLKPNLLDPIFGILPKEASVELRMVSATPTRIERAIADRVLALTMNRKWLCLHGAVLSAIEKPVEAARRQIAVDEDASHKAGLQFALRSASPRQVVECAVVLGDRRLVALAAEFIADDPNIFTQRRCASRNEQAVWEAVIQLKDELWQVPAQPEVARDTALNALMDGSEYYPPLIVALSRTPLADLCGFPRREELWTRLGTEAKGGYLRGTAVGWLELCTKGAIPFTPDVELGAVLLANSDIDACLGRLASNIPAGVRIIDAIGRFDEARFIRWLRIVVARSAPISIPDAEALGRLALSHRWHQAVDEMVYRVRDRRNDLKPALRVCSSMLGMLTRWTLELSRPSLSEKWKTFEDTAAELYQCGPDEEEIWERAGGKNADLPRSGSGRSRWRTALSQVRKGGEPSAAKLLREMMVDYPANETLRYLSKDRDIVGR
jgi:hypothetical protein